MQLKDYFKKGKAYIWPETFAYIKAKKIDSNAFANIVDKDEITVIIDQTKYNKNNVINILKDWKLITLDIKFPITTCGVTAIIATALAKEKIPIMSIASYTRDHFLIRSKYINKAVKVFDKLGIKTEK